MADKKKVIIIGSGFAGLSAACFLAKEKYEVIVLEKNATPGGRARQLEIQDFKFDMGPSWYWMPDIFERFFEKFDRKVSDYYELKRLDPSYRVYFKDEHIDIPANYNELKEIFENLEKGSGKKLDAFLTEAEYKYKVGINKLVYKPGNSIKEFFDVELLQGVFKLEVFKSMKNHVARFFIDERIKQILEFPVLFLGAMAEKIPALYSLMNYADIKGGTWFPKHGMYSIVKAMTDLACNLGVKFYFNNNVTEIVVQNKSATNVIAYNNNEKKLFNADVVIANADYHFVEMNLLEKKNRSYSEKYWDKKMMAPGCILYYVGINKKLKNVLHHSLFFDTSFDVHGKEIYETKEWPANPLFYVCAASVTDESVAPENCENLFFLIPVAAGLTSDSEPLREYYFDMIVERMEKRTGEKIKDHIIYKKSFAYSDFVNDYNAYKGNAYGLANTLLQTAILKPKCRSKKVKNLFYTGQLTVPGPGVPPALISGEVVAKEVMKYFRN